MRIIYKKFADFISERDSDLRIFIQVLTMCICNFIGLIIWLVIRIPCSPLIILAPGIMVATVFLENRFKNRVNKVYLSGILMILFQVGVIMLLHQKIMLIIWVFIIVYIMFASPKLRYVSSYALLPCATAFSMPYGALSALNRTVEVIFSALITVIILFIVNELSARVRIRSALKCYISEIHKLYKSKSGLAETAESNNNIVALSLKAINIVNKQEYFMRENNRYAKKMKRLLMSLHCLARGPNLLKNVKDDKEYKIIISNIDDLFYNLKRTYRAGGILEFDSNDLTKIKNKSDNSLNEFYNGYAIINILKGFHELNGFNVE